MSRNEFDDLLLKKLREEELPYNPESWNKLAQLLPTSRPIAAYKGRKWLLATGVAAAIAFTLATVFFIKLMHSEQKREEQALRTTQKSALMAEVMPSAASTIPEKVQINTNTIQGQQVKGTDHLLANNAAQNVSPVNHSKSSAAAEDPENQVIPGPTTPQNPSTPIHNETITQKEPTSPIAPKEENIAAVAANKPNYPTTFYNNKSTGSHRYNKTSVGLGGGMSYGNLNAGYSVGISARTKIAGDFFVDGTVAMLYNNNTVNTGINNGPSLGGNDNLAARPAAFAKTVPAPAVTPIQKLYYVQFNPSLGYQVEKHIAIAIGGDFQQMLNPNQEIVQQAANKASILPNFDIGLTTKSEFSITPNIQAGLLYREGLNNMLKNVGDARYVNRRYIQVQFKYNLPIN